MATLHPTLERMKARIKGRSDAKTARGVLNTLRQQQLIGEAWARTEKQYARLTAYLRSADEYRKQEAARKADPEAKRARYDDNFRRNYFRRLCKRESSARRYDAATLDGIIEFWDTIDDRTKELREVERLRNVSIQRPLRTCGQLEPHDQSVIISDFSAELARKHGASVNMSGKNARLTACRERSRREHEGGVTHWRNGKPKGYTRATNDNYVRSFGLIVSPLVFDYVFHTTRKRCELPEGYSWNVDANGLRIVRDGTPDDYHPSAADLLAKQFPANCIGALNYNAERRRTLKAQEVANRAKVAGVYVCLADSIRAGNCAAGSRAFAVRHGLDVRRHYEAPELLDMANGEAHFVRLAITAAAIRHKRELEQGFSLLADHVLN